MWKKHHILTLLLFIVTAIATLVVQFTMAVEPSNPPPHDPPYPAAWWEPISRENAPPWEIFPQDAKYGEVILSKRNELGIFSNFAATPFKYKGKSYASIEGFWQATKFPENTKDARAYAFKNSPYTRAQVEQMTGFEAKKAGDYASEIMKEHDFHWVTFEGQQMIYREEGESPFYHLIRSAMWEKLKQNPQVEELLLKTDQLVLRPDHAQSVGARKAWHYNEIWMDFRAILKSQAAPKN